MGKLLDSSYTYIYTYAQKCIDRYINGYIRICIYSYLRIQALAFRSMRFVAPSLRALQGGEDRWACFGLIVGSLRIRSLEFVGV